MASVIFQCSSSNKVSFQNVAQIRITYLSKNGTLTITEIEGRRTDEFRSYDLGVTEINMSVNEQTKVVSLNRGVDFDTTWKAFGVDNISWEDLPEGQLSVVVEMPNTSPTLYEAKFTGEIDMVFDKYTIAYDANGGSGTPDSQTKTYNTDIYLSSVIPTKTGYEFVEWVSNEPKSYQPNDVVTYNGNLTLVAQWEATEWLKNKTITMESLGALHKYNTERLDALQKYSEDTYIAKTNIIPLANGGTGSDDGTIGLKNLFAAGITILSENQYGDTLPEAGTVGRIFFKKLSE